MKEKENLMNLNSNHELSHTTDSSNKNSHNSNNNSSSNNDNKKDNKGKKFSMVPILNNNNNLNLNSNPYNETLAGVLLGDSHYNINVDITGSDIDPNTGTD